MLPEPTPARVTPRSRVDVIQAQLAAIEAWNATRRATEAAVETSHLTREMRLDVTRRRQARHREQQAVIARADEHLRDSGQVLGARDGIRAVIAHRNEWLRGKVVGRLAERGVCVVGAFEDGADAAGAMVVEQAELLLVEDRLPTLPGVDVVRRVRAFSPLTVIGAHVLDSGGVAAHVDAGARAVFTRRIPPVEIADQLLDCLTDGRSLTLV